MIATKPWWLVAQLELVFLVPTDAFLERSLRTLDQNQLRSGWAEMVDLSEWSPDPYILVLTGLGVLIALVAWLPLALKRLPLSLPVVCIALGAVLFVIPQVSDQPLPMTYPEFTERFTEFVVIIALMGAGLKLDRIFSWRRWGVTWRLLVITMPLSIAAITVVGVWGLASG